VKGVKMCCMSNTVFGTNDSSCVMEVKRMGMLGVSVRKVKMETVTLTGEGRWNLTCFVY
jgi:hypothetical protein